MARHKYGAIPTTVDGIRFASKKEARRYSELLLLQRAGEIEDLQLQPVFVLKCQSKSGELVAIAKYLADFQYVDRRGGLQVVVEDVKGVRTQVYKIKKRWVEAQYGITIKEV